MCAKAEQYNTFEMPAQVTLCDPLGKHMQNYTTTPSQRLCRAILAKDCVGQPAIKSAQLIIWAEKRGSVSQSGQVSLEVFTLSAG